MVQTRGRAAVGRERRREDAAWVTRWRLAANDNSPRWAGDGRNTACRLSIGPRTAQDSIAEGAGPVQSHARLVRHIKTRIWPAQILRFIENNAVAAEAQRIIGQRATLALEG